MPDTSVVKTSDQTQHSDNSSAPLNQIDRLALLKEYSQTAPNSSDQQSAQQPEYLSFSDPYHRSDLAVGSKNSAQANARTSAEVPGSAGGGGAGGGEAGGGEADGESDGGNDTAGGRTHGGAKSGSDVPASSDHNVHRDSAGRVTEVDYSNGSNVKVTYDGDDQKTITLPYGHVLTENKPDPDQKTGQPGINSGQQRRYTESDQNINDIVPDGFNMAAGVTRDGALVTEDDNTQTAQIRYPNNSSDTYDGFGDLTQHINASGAATDYHYDKGLLTGVTDSDHHEWKRDVGTGDGDAGDGRFTELDKNGKPTAHTVSAAHFLPPTSDTSLYTQSNNQSFKNAYNDFDQVLGNHPVSSPTSGDISPNGVVQGKLGDCYFESSVASLANEDPSAIKNMIHDNKNGSFTVTFPGDPSNPVTIEAPTAEEMAQFGADEKGDWAAVLEKAHRYYSNRVGADYGSTPDRALYLLTGKDFKDTPLVKDQWNKPWTYFEGPSAAQIGSTIENSLDKKEPVVAYALKDTDTVPNHAFSVIGYDAKDQTVTVRNPYGQVGFDSSKIKSFKDLGHGEFSLSLNDFGNEFSGMDTQRN